MPEPGRSNAAQRQSADDGRSGQGRLELSVEERWAVVAYLRALQLSQSASVEQLPPDIRQRLESAPPNKVKSPP